MTVHSKRTDIPNFIRIIEKAENSTFYLLAELDRTPLAGTTAGNRLKKFYSREIANMLREQDNSSGRTGTSGSQEILENEADDRGDEEEHRDRENDEDSD